MCGRYANFLTEQELTDAFAIASVADDARLLPPSWNVAPTQDVAVIRAATDSPQDRELTVAAWGLVPSWAKDPSIGPRMINARSETVADKPSFRSAFAKRRCVVPANGYYEWRTRDGVKTPHYIHTADGSPLAFAGLYEFWRDKQASDDDPWLVTCSILTTGARDAMRDLHDRQPVMLAHQEQGAWLDTASSPQQLFDAIDAPTPDLTWHAVDRAVGNVRNNTAALTAPV